MFHRRAYGLLQNLNFGVKRKQALRNVVYTRRGGKKEQEKRAKYETIKAELLSTGKIQSSNYWPKVPRGTRDYDPTETAIRESVLSSIRDAFLRHGAVTYDTPTFEMRQTLMGKYGEEAANIVFHLEDQGDELLSLRYDLTVPFARYLIMHSLGSMKRYHIGKVYRHERTATTQGRYREFYQCDFDIAGNYDLMLPEVDCLKILNEILVQLDIGKFKIMLSHRKLLEGIVEVCEIPAQLFKSVCSAIDKLDKSSWSEVENTLINQRGLNSEQTRKLGKLVRLRELSVDLGNKELLNQMRELPAFNDNPNFKKGVEELEVLIKYCDLLGVDNVKFDPSLARGLDYYTGAIYEAKLDHEIHEEGAPISLGSLAAGGRYDELVSTFNPQATVPCCGVSLGVERLFKLVEAKFKRQKTQIRSKQTQVYVASAQKGMLEERLRLCRRLWDAGFKTEFPYKINPKLLDQLQFCESNAIPLAVIIGEAELQNGIVKVRKIASREEKEVPATDLIDAIRKMLEELD